MKFKKNSFRAIFIGILLCIMTFTTYIEGYSDDNCISLSNRSSIKAIQSDTIEEPQTRFLLPKHILFNNKKYEVIGTGYMVARFSIFSLNAGVIGIYTENPQIDSSKKLNNENKIVNIHFLIKASSSMIQQLFEQYLENKIDKETAEKFCNVFVDMSKGDELQFRIFPTGRLEVLLNQQLKGEFEAQKLAEALLSLQGHFDIDSVSIDIKINS